MRTCPSPRSQKLQSRWTRCQPRSRKDHRRATERLTKTLPGSEPTGSQDGGKAEDKQEADQRRKAESLSEDQRKLRDLAVKHGHVPIIRNGHAFCKVCSSYAAKGWEKSNLVKQTCTGPSIQVGNLNRLWAGLNPQAGRPFDKVT